MKKQTVRPSWFLTWNWPSFCNGLWWVTQSSHLRWTLLLDLPSYSYSLTIHDSGIEYFHDSFITGSPTALYHVAKGDYLTLWKDVEALHFMSRYCVCCDERFDFDTDSSHMRQHWTEITLLPKFAYPECADKFMSNFRSLPWFQDIPCYQAVLHQVLIIRLLVELWHDGPRRCRDAGDLVQRLAQRRIAEGLQTAEISGPTFSEKEQGPNDREEERSRSRHKRSHASIGSTCPASRRLNPGDAATATIHPPPQKWTRKLAAATHEEEPDVACGRGEEAPSKVLPCTADAGDTSGKGQQTSPSITPGCDLSGQAQAGSRDGGSLFSFLELASTQETVGVKQGQSSDSRGTDRYLGSDFPGPSGPIERPAISHLEEVATRSRSASRGRIFMGNDSDSDATPAIAETLLSQHLATRGCGLEASNISPHSTCKASGASSSQRAVRICLNKPQVFCWMNSIMIALTWLGLVTMYPMEAWIDTCWVFQELTKFTP